MSRDDGVRVLPYNRVIGQSDLKLALELNYIEPRIGGVLISVLRRSPKPSSLPEAPSPAHAARSM